MSGVVPSLPQFAFVAYMGTTLAFALQLRKKHGKTLSQVQRIFLDSWPWTLGHNDLSKRRWMFIGHRGLSSQKACHFFPHSHFPHRRTSSLTPLVV